ncbi:hypothetical protein [Sphingomonas sp. SORGH_AS_0879]|uniref:hypothetical protein n=1 Tax=Sphingomonas sp. SORGH_AS_0879 TaxID=3041790 RepID=UPI0027D86666|nr:hypothetical protein [Sphingomonas sp. SORGH_AS_0879]
MNVAALDVGYRLGLDRKIPIGAAVLTARLQGPTIHFSLDSYILRPSDPADALLAWLDQRLTTDGATITGYRMKDAIALLDRLPGAEWSPALRALAGCGQQYLLDLSATVGDGPLTLQEACVHSQVLCAPGDPDRRFADWVRSDVGEIEQDAQVDAIATFRLVIRRLAKVNPVGHSIATAISGHFAEWLGEADYAATRLHVADLLSAAD